LESELAHIDRLAYIGRLAAGVAHEIGNPITGISCIVQNLQHIDSLEGTDQAYGDILTQTERINHILKALTNFSRSGPQRQGHERFELDQVIHSATHLAELTYKNAGIQFHAECPQGLELEGDPQTITQVLINLLSNAGDACSDGTTVQLIATEHDNHIEIDVIDSGKGIPQSLQAHIFEPFFTTKAVGQGTGLGLSIVHRIIEEHGGTISLHSTEGSGTTIHISIPSS
jgi:signal transduction histidine kinase